MLSEIIQTHNRVNGFLFSAVEFVVMALIVAPFAIYYLAHNRWVYGLVATGIAANSIAVVVFALRSIAAGESSIGIGKMLRRETRVQIAAQYPDLQRQTIILTVALLLPFILPLVVGIEAVAAARPGN